MIAAAILFQATVSMAQNDAALQSVFSESYTLEYNKKFSEAIALLKKNYNEKSYELNLRLGHPNDINPVPANGCPASPLFTSDGKITICHATGSQTNPYNEIKVSVIGLNGHGTHEGDVFSSPEGGCPSASGVIGNSNTTTLGAFGNRITTTLVAFGNRITTALSSIGNRTTSQPLTICHATDDPANPYEEITVNRAELNEHRGHPNDINPAPEGGCPTSPWTTSYDKITICHATGSQNNPYNEITVSVNGLNGHDQHEGDIIPMPEGGCPTK